MSGAWATGWALRRPVLDGLAGKRMAATTAAGVAALALAAYVLAASGVPLPGHPPRSGTPAAPAALVIQSAELRYATAPTPGVWAELKVVLDNPSAASATRTAILVPGTLLEDFKIRATEPKLLAPPQRRPDGRYALVFPAPLSRSLNWFRAHLTCRRAAPRPVQLGILLEGTRPLQETAPKTARVSYADRQADPFIVVPEPLVSWVPGQARGAFPVLVVYAVAVAATTAVGCVVAFWTTRR